MNIEAKRIRELRARGVSLRTIARQLAVGLGTIQRVLATGSKIVCGAAAVNDRPQLDA